MKINMLLLFNLLIYLEWNDMNHVVIIIFEIVMVHFYYQIQQILIHLNVQNFIGINNYKQKEKITLKLYLFVIKLIYLKQIVIHIIEEFFFNVLKILHHH